MELQFRPLKASEIDVRIAMVKKDGLSLLLYKDARCDMNLLDETVGPYNWKKSYSRDNANCTVSLWDSEKGEWISKEDTGTESFTEKEKGLASDSFKRACFNWGIGRELYTAPFIWVTNAAIYKRTVNGKDIFKCDDRFAVKDIKYDENKNIVELVITNLTNKKQAYPINYSESSNEATGAEPTNTTPKTFKCKMCGNEVTEKVAKFSYGKYQKILCMDCQKK
ncbi:MAG: hypothetical protein E7208_02040 [Clostridium butyricum]|nr:hypothetical protein [Clostridium butyricum]